MGRVIHPAVVKDVRARAVKANVKLGGRIASSPDVADVHRLAALGEEYGEVCRLLEPGDANPADLYDELIDVANVALLWATYLIRGWE